MHASYKGSLRLDKGRSFSFPVIFLPFGFTIFSVIATSQDVSSPTKSRSQRAIPSFFAIQPYRTPAFSKCLPLAHSSFSPLDAK